MSASPTLSGFCKTIGLRLLRTDKECVIGEVDATHQYFTARGRVHGGLLMSFGDSLGAIGTALNMPENHATSTIESKTNFFHAPKHGRLQGAAIPLHVGRTTQVWRTDITDLTGRTVATVTQTQLVIANGVPASEPAQPDAARKPDVKTAAGESIPEQRRRQIFEAASEVFGRKGYASASVRDIADAAGMPVPTMYQYCRSKEDILSMVFDTYMRELGGSVQAAGSVQGTPAKRMKNAVSASLSMHDKYRHQIKLMFQETGSLGPQNRARVLQTTRSANEIWAELIREGNKTGDFNVGSPALVANFIPIVAASWVLRRWNMDGATLAEMHDALEQFVMHGLSGPPRSGAQRQTTKRAAKKFVRAKRADAR